MTVIVVVAGGCCEMNLLETAEGTLRGYREEWKSSNEGITKRKQLERYELAQRSDKRGTNIIEAGGAVYSRLNVKLGLKAGSKE